MPRFKFAKGELGSKSSMFFEQSPYGNDKSARGGRNGQPTRARLDPRRQRHVAPRLPGWWRTQVAHRRIRLGCLCVWCASPGCLCVWCALFRLSLRLVRPASSAFSFGAGWIGCLCVWCALFWSSLRLVRFGRLSLRLVRRHRPHEAQKRPKPSARSAKAAERPARSAKTNETFRTKRKDDRGTITKR